MILRAISLLGANHLLQSRFVLFVDKKVDFLFATGNSITILSVHYHFFVCWDLLEFFGMYVLPPSQGMQWCYFYLLFLHFLARKHEHIQLQWASVLFLVAAPKYHIGVIHNMLRIFTA